MTLADVVVVGAGHAGTAVVAALRQQGYDGRLTVVSDEGAFPYDRPPLSKAMFSGGQRLPLVPESFFDDRDVTLLRGSGVTVIDRWAKTIGLDDGARLSYGTLVLAMGAGATRLPLVGADLDGVHVLRTLEESLALEEGVSESGALVVVGGGWIGLEVASAARSAGHAVTVIERESRVLARVASAELARLVESAHRAQGTDTRTGADVVAFDGDDLGRVRAVRLADGTSIPCGRVLVAVGAQPRDTLAASAGLVCQGGIVVDGSGRTADASILAVGDVTRRPVEGRPGTMRLESIPSAQEQARRAVASMLGIAPQPLEVPWFWSDQADLKIQIAGLLPEAATVTVHEDPKSGGVAVCHLEEDVLRCIEAVGATGLFKEGKRLIRSADRVPLSVFAAPKAPGEVEVGDARRPLPPMVTFRAADGVEREVGVEVGATLMEAAANAGVPGILAECGGGCSCGTCHVHLEEVDLVRFPPPCQLEMDMLEFVDGACEGSRLSCQLIMTADLDGMVVGVPESSC